MGYKDVEVPVTQHRHVPVTKEVQVEVPVTQIEYQDVEVPVQQTRQIPREVQVPVPVPVTVPRHVPVPRYVDVPFEQIVHSVRDVPQPVQPSGHWEWKEDPVPQTMPTMPMPSMPMPSMPMPPMPMPPMPMSTPYVGGNMFGAMTLG